MDLPSSLIRDISPPPPLKRRKTSGAITPSDTTANNAYPKTTPSIEPTLAAVEAGKAKVDNHLAYFKDHLAKASRKTAPEISRLSIDDFSTLYQNNHQENGHHFVVHQHNHPRAGVHYDLRLQFSETSSMSFALPKGLPGDPNSRSIGRMAIETRVHNYWNHLIESASRKTGSLLIWDTGTYEVLPRKMTKGGGKSMPSPVTTDEEDSEPESERNGPAPTPQKAETEKHENDKLISAFQTRYIRLRLHGTRLPNNYTIILRLPSNEIIKRPTTRRKKSRQKAKSRVNTQGANTDSEPEPDLQLEEQNQDEDLDTDSNEDAQTRASNAYPGSTNDIGSIHQRHWFLQLDRHNSGFLLEKDGDSKGKWVRGPKGGGL
ncbi:uncharacterized protein K460DRAFT_369860 [Cucurbitaria berberidis CBS 394.84]|uniref:DNA ligase D 3'-phosphoesterase domain-containing protein n=1 Tax=Cucurbitaria berberidis CBS 394.84 TaxID=1168544 RepID=A0A9P4GAA1_9PLEO|nr:uncharacterized protein K460DRAFT_369860 [Cucurbitaria berberidis CBS 394.84]KAF1841844.1 hypothetical protein K460DRAFT_369860 [Cucurbitaria berberidis CBS 394.84]